MLAGTPATFVTTRDSTVFNALNDAILPGDLDGSTAPPAGAPAPFLMSGTAATWKLWRYHVDFGTPGNSTFTLGGFDGEDDVHVILNMYWEPLEFALPTVAGRQWHRVVDTSLASPQDVADPGQELQIDGAKYRVNDRSVVILVSK